MADAYLAEIRAIQPKGPYLLGGYSGGGIIAFEMARRITAIGEEVGLLAFLDTYHPHMPMSKVTIGSRVWRLLTEGWGYLEEAIERQRNNERVAQVDAEIDAHVARGGAMPLRLRERYLWRSFERAQALYVPQPWSGRAMLIRAEVPPYFYRAGGDDYGWHKHVTGGIDLVTVPGYHENLLLGENAERLVGSLGGAIDRVIQSHAGAGELKIA
jgi:thioesterase domain-containing protein